MAEFSLDEFESINLASELMVETETKTSEVKRASETVNNEQAKPGTDSEKIAVNEIISPDDSAGYLVDGIDAIMTIAGGAFYSIKAFNILTKDQKKIVSEAKKKPEASRTDEERQLINFLKEEKTRLEEKSNALDLTEREIAKLKKSSRGMIKVKNWKIGPEFAFWVTLVDIISDRAIDAFMD